MQRFAGHRYPACKASALGLPEIPKGYLKTDWGFQVAFRGG